MALIITTVIGVGFHQCHYDCIYMTSGKSQLCIHYMSYTAGKTLQISHGHSYELI